MRQITEITRRDIFSLFMNGMVVSDFYEDKKIYYDLYGKLSEIDFLKRIYNLKTLPSYDERFKNAEDDILQHTVYNDDFKNGWIFEDDRFGLLNGDDEILLKFLCSVFHPAVRIETGCWKKFFNTINGLLQNDGYELYPENKISGRYVYAWRRYDPEASALFIPFSQRHELEIKSKQIKLSLNMKTRNQILKLFEKYSTVYLETNDTGLQYNISTNEYIFRDISQFYEPKYFNENGDYVKATDIEHFILSTSPYCVFDAIEFYDKYNSDNDFAARINAIFKLNTVAYKLEQGCIESKLEVTIDKKGLSAISEKGLKELLNEADRYYRLGNKQIAVEKMWDAFERMKTYYSPALGKSESADKIIDDMSGSEPNFKSMYDAEFKCLTKIGNTFRIRHHETTKVDITDSRQYEYFYKRCLSLVSVAILYLEGGTSE